METQIFLQVEDFIDKFRESQKEIKSDTLTTNSLTHETSH